MSGNSTALLRLLAATLSVSGVWQLLPPLASAQLVPLTAAGTPIRNTATAEYEDPSQPGTKINATSNTVTATVAEVAGITVIANGISDSTSTTPVLPTDILTYAFLITNVGNDTTQVLIPTPVVTGPATQTGSITYDIDLNGDGTPEITGGTLTDATNAILLPGGTIKVNVPVKVDLSATSGAPIKVQLGETAPNDNSAATQNQPTTNLATDLQTKDAPDTTTGETTGSPTNGEREASAVSSILVGANPQAFAAILKTLGTYSDNSTPTVFNDDLQTYNLSLRVDSAAPAGASPSLTPADLTGTPITVTELGGTVTKVLVSDAIPAGTVLNATPTPPDGTWTVVYSITDTATSNGNTAVWTTTAPSTLSTTKRVGFIKDGPIAKGTTVTGFLIQVKTTGLSAVNGGTVNNIAQLFGQSVGGTTVVYDESGDTQPSNFNSDGSVGPGPNGVGSAQNGVANPTNDGVDSAGNNSGIGLGGEDTALILAPAGAILNGPLNTPAAVGPTDNNDDFTNKSTAIAANTAPGTSIDPPSLSFSNTLNAPATTLTNVLVRPVAPAVVTDLPVGTTATLTYGAQTAVYTYQVTGAVGTFVFTSGVAIQIPTIPGNSSVNYTVDIDLPSTALSTDSGKGYPVPILAFADLNGDGVLQVGTESNNTTIDRVYTGFLRLLKKSQILQGTGPLVTGTNGTLDTTAKSPSPGNIINYVIEYTNISTPPAGSGNVILDATKVIITESGVIGGATGNNWGINNSNGVITTSHVTSTAVDSGTGATITFFSGALGTTSVTEQSGTTQTTDITKYIDTLSVPVAPGATTRTFTFQRKLN
ncbi:hypothetical protein HCU40_09835 [Pseudanabaena biceps]|nr:hypothetical protein [Pseudanabaena biceps]